MSDKSGRTTRQRMFDLLAGQELFARDFTELLSIPVREVEDHLTHLVKTVGRQSNKLFLLVPSQCKTADLSLGRERASHPQVEALSAVANSFPLLVIEFWKNRQSSFPSVFSNP